MYLLHSLKTLNNLVIKLRKNNKLIKLLSNTNLDRLTQSKSTN